MNQDYDADRFYLGTLCRNGHDFNETGCSLRYVRSPVCVTCAINNRKRRDDKLRVIRLASRPSYPDGMKKCPACETHIPLSSWRCQPCKTKYTKDHYAKHIDTRRAKARASARIYRETNWYMSLWRGCRSSSKKRGLTLTITSDFVQGLWEKQNGRCYWTGVPMIKSGEIRHPLRVSIDRIDSTIGYDEDNVVLTCMLINLGRSNSSVDITIAALDAIVVNYHEKLARAL